MIFKLAKMDNIYVIQNDNDDVRIVVMKLFSLSYSIKVVINKTKKYMISKPLILKNGVLWNEDYKIDIPTFLNLDSSIKNNTIFDVDYGDSRKNDYANQFKVELKRNSLSFFPVISLIGQGMHVSLGLKEYYPIIYTPKYDPDIIAIADMRLELDPGAIIGFDKDNVYMVDFSFPEKTKLNFDEITEEYNNSFENSFEYYENDILLKYDLTGSIGIWKNSSYSYKRSFKRSSR